MFTPPLLSKLSHGQKKKTKCAEIAKIETWSSSIGQFAPFHFAEAAIANIPINHLIPLVSNHRALQQSFFHHIQYVFAPLRRADFEAAWTIREGFDEQGFRADIPPDPDTLGVPAVLLDQAFDLYKKCLGPCSRQQHRRRHSDPCFYRDKLKSTMPAFPVMLLPSTPSQPRPGIEKELGPACTFWPMPHLRGHVPGGVNKKSALGVDDTSLLPMDVMLLAEQADSAQLDPDYSGNEFSDDDFFNDYDF